MVAAGHLLMTMCRGSPTHLADPEDGPRTVLGGAEGAEKNRPMGPGDLLVILGSTVAGLSSNQAEENPPSGPGVDLLVIQGSTVASSHLSTTRRLTRGFLGAVGCVRHPPIIRPILTDLGPGVQAGGPLRSYTESTSYPMSRTASAT